MEEVAIVIPIYKNQLDSYEFTSLRCVYSFAKGNYPIVFVGYKGIHTKTYEKVDLDSNDITWEFFNQKYFKSIQSYNRLLLLPEFYKRLINYKHILIYQLDCFLFKDELANWIAKDYDFVGAPWMNTESNGFESIGLNGGLSLRKVKSHLKALKSLGMIYQWTEIKEDDFYKSAPWYKRVYFWLAARTFRNNTYHLFNDFQGNEDAFFSIYVARRFSWFKVPDCEIASEFAFERAPSWLYDYLGRQLPMGCHAWHKYETDFWQKFIK